MPTVPINEPLAAGVDLSSVALPRSLACGEVFGGNEPVHTAIELPGLHGVLYSRPSQGARGGDVHYLSVCGSGLLARVCVADVMGHGEVVAKVSAQMHAHLRRSVDVIDERRVFREMDQRLQAVGEGAMTTAALVTYYPPSRRLTLSYAGHPPGWIFSASGQTWDRLTVAGEQRPGVAMNLPLGTGLVSNYGRARRRVTVGDRLVLVTDGVLDAAAPNGAEFGVGGIERVLDEGRQRSPRDLVDALLAAVTSHTAGGGGPDDDVTIFVGEIVAGPRGPAVWHVLRNRLLIRLMPSLRDR
jgi:phosphoserine phosphatase RsbU/P